MKKLCAAFGLLVLLMFQTTAFAAETSSDTMILDWSSSKVWVNGGELCVMGTFFNKRSDVTVTKLNEFTMTITFTREDGTTYQFTGQPKKLPMFKIPAGKSKRITFNFGPFDGGSWKKWVTSEKYVFSYINGAAW